jgi:hypothetical protein
MFWLKTIVASAICLMAVEIRIKSWMDEHGYNKDDIKGTKEDKMFLLCLLCIPLVNIVFATVMLVGSFSDAVMEEAMKNVKK